MYEVFEHTADLGLRVRAVELPGLFEEAARAMFAVMVADLARVRPGTQQTFILEAPQREDLLRDWLAELLYAFHAEHLLFSRFSVELEGAQLHGSAWGEPIDPGRHVIQTELKAVTYHGLMVQQTLDGWLAEVIIDT